jgi:hypothetical protein
MSVYNTKDTPVSVTKLKELLSTKGDGKAVPEGVTIWYKERLLDRDGQEMGYQIKKVEKKVGGRATPRTFDKRDTDKVGSMNKSDIDTKGNIKSPRTFKVYENGKARKGTDLEYLRKRRGKQKITKPPTPPPLRLKQGGAVKKPKGTGVSLRGFGKALKR